VFYFIVATLLIPAAVTFVPSFVLVSSLGWVSTLRGLIVPGLFQAFATFLFRQYFLNFPRELEEAAQLDGTAYWGTFWQIVVPNSKGFIAAIGTITFIGSWNAFLWPLVIAQGQDSWTVQIALSTFLTAQTINLPQLFIAATIAILPLVVMFVFLQRWIVEGVERTGISE
jgi:multiple sugar transport system permease protein